MALRQKLSKPFVVPPLSDHTHTVVFLHRFPESTSDEELPNKVLSAKRTRNHKTLQEQFPTVRWVFPFAKTGPRTYGNLTVQDKVAVGLANSSTPYIAQILLQEAKLVDGLDNVILGGQGETAVAGHEAMTSFPELGASLRSDVAQVVKYLSTTFHSQSWTDLAMHPRLAGFVGMHAEAREVTRDVSSHSIASKVPNNPPRINTSIVVNTPHCFIHGGYKTQTVTWDGRRIDDFARFLATTVGVYRVEDRKVQRGLQESLAPKIRSEQQAEKKDDLSEAQKYALELASDKKANEALADKIRRRIEADKVERKIRQAREREARLAAAESAKSAANTSDSVERDGSRSRESGLDIPGPRTLDGAVGSPRFFGDADLDGNGSESNDSSHDIDEMETSQTNPGCRLRPRKRALPGRRVAGDMDWEEQKRERGEMSDTQKKALGLPVIKKEESE